MQHALSTGTTAASCSISLTGVTAGHGIAVFGRTTGESISSLSDGSDTVTVDISPVGVQGAFLAHIHSSVGGNLTMTLTLSASNYCIVGMAEYSTTLTIDSASKASVTGKTQPWSLDITTSAKPNEAIVSYEASHDDCNGTSGAFTLLDAKGGDCSSDDIVSATGTYTATYTENTSTTAVNDIVGAGFYTAATNKSRRIIIIRH